MVEDDTFTYHGKPQPSAQKATAPHSLITKERTQKLDLLIHLLSNLPQALVVCGPEGIGKTTLIEALQERKTEAWQYCLVQGNAALSFESVQRQLARILADGDGYSSAGAHGRPRQIVLIVDNAGELVPGLITMIVQYAAANPVLKVIFALTHDELQVKRGSDRAIDDCHIVEIPPLSEKQCGDFLQYLSGKPYANVSFKAISESMVAHIYRATHGVPGKIIAEVSSGLPGAQQNGKLKWILAAAIGGALIIAVGIQLLLSSSPKNDKETPAPAAVERTQDNAGTAATKPAEQITLPLPPAAPPVTQPQPQPMSVNETPVQQNSTPKNALDAVTENDANKDVQPLAVPAAKPEPEPAAVVKQPANAPQAAVAPVLPKAPIASPAPIEPVPLEPIREKPKQSESNRPTSSVGAVATEKASVKQPAKPAGSAELAQSTAGKPSDSAQKKTAEQLWAAREKLKQTELNQALDNTNLPVANPQPLPVPSKPVEITSLPPVQPAEPVSPISTTLPAQSATEGNFTLQLMVLSKQSSVNEIFNKHPAMASDIRVINVVVNGKEKFILEYGSYPDSASANQARQSLPFEFRRALVRKK